MKNDAKLLDQDLVLPLDIVSERWARLSTGIIRLGGAVFLCLVFVAAVAPVREIAIANGQLVTSQPPVIIKHLDGGQIEKVFVKIGEFVEYEAPIISLSGVEMYNKMNQLEASEVRLLLQRERILAHVEKRNPNFSNWQSQFAHLVDEQSALFYAESTVIDTNSAAIDAEVAELNMEYNAAIRQLNSMLAQSENIEAELQNQEGLLKKGFLPRSQTSNTKREANRIRSSYAAAQRTTLEINRSISNLRRSSIQQKTKQIQTWSEQVSQLALKLSEIREERQQIQEKISRLVIYAPVSGVLHELEFSSIKEVVAPGEPIATIVPADSVLVAEVRVDPSDIGFVEVGSFAELVISTFDREIFGTMQAQVLSISPTSFQGHDQQPYFLTTLSLKYSILDKQNNPIRLGSGMVVQAEFRTGEKSILRYVLKPLIQPFDLAFSER